MKHCEYINNDYNNNNSSLLSAIVCCYMNEFCWRKDFFNRHENTIDFLEIKVHFCGLMDDQLAFVLVMVKDQRYAWPLIELNMASM